MSRTFRVATYNIHKGRGMDMRVRPARILKVLREIDADIIALQEILSVEGQDREKDQVRFLAESLGFRCQMGANRMLQGGGYGNAILSRFPLGQGGNHDLSVPGYEERGCLRADVLLSETETLHAFSVHLGTTLRERRLQGKELVEEAILEGEDRKGPRLVLGDFNEWPPGLTTRLLAGRLTNADDLCDFRRPRTYLGLLPLVDLDHIYFDDGLFLARLARHRTWTSLMASDHLPLVADFHWEASNPVATTRRAPVLPPPASLLQQTIDSLGVLRGKRPAAAGHAQPL